jgi:hypothetical protein
MQIDLEPKDWKSQPRKGEPFFGSNKWLWLRMVVLIVISGVILDAYRNWPNWP